jgi:4-amino-4-deoxy-L-arabinose transferase-like glycosyltransferase
VTRAAPSLEPSSTRGRLSFLPSISWILYLLPVAAIALLRDLWAPDEPRYAMVAKWIYDHGEFLVLRRCGTLYPDKPPLVYWLAGLFGWVSAWSVPAMRLVSILPMFGAAWFTTRFAQLWLGPREERWAPLLFVGFALILWNAGRIALDPLLTFGCVGALYFAARPAADTRAATRDALLAGALLGVGMFAKGPVALVNTGLPFLAWRLFKLNAPGARAPRWSIAAALALAVLPVALWAVAASLQEPQLWRPLFFGQHLERAAKGTAHAGPPWQHLLQLPLLLLPWSVPVAYGFVDGFRAWRARANGDAEQLALARIWVWAAALLVFFSIIPAKRELYLMCAYPAFALLGARRIVFALQRGVVGAWAAAVPLGIFTLLGLVLIAAGFAAEPLLASSPRFADAQREYARILAAYPDVAWRSAISGSILCVGAAMSWRAWRARRFTSWASGVAVTWCVGSASVFALLLPVNDVVKSDRELAALLAAQPGEPQEIPFYDTHPEGPRFYGAGPCVSAPVEELLDGGLERRADQAGPNFLAVARESRWRAKPQAERERFREIALISVGSRELVVLGLADPARGAR